MTKSSGGQECQGGRTFLLSILKSTVTAFRLEELLGASSVPSFNSALLGPQLSKFTFAAKLNLASRLTPQSLLQATDNLLCKPQLSAKKCRSPTKTKTGNNTPLRHDRGAYRRSSPGASRRARHRALNTWPPSARRRRVPAEAPGRDSVGSGPVLAPSAPRRAPGRPFPTNGFGPVRLLPRARRPPRLPRRVAGTALGTRSRWVLR